MHKNVVVSNSSVVLVLIPAWNCQCGVASPLVYISSLASSHSPKTCMLRELHVYIVIVSCVRLHRNKLVASGRTLTFHIPVQDKKRWDGEIAVPNFSPPSKLYGHNLSQQMFCCSAIVGNCEVKFNEQQGFPFFIFIQQIAIALILSIT